MNSSSFLSNNTPPIGPDEQEYHQALKSKKKTFMSLKSTGDVDNMLANINHSSANQKTYDQRLASTEMSYYLQTAAKRTGAANDTIKKSKPINVTPAGQGRPYCRHKEFQKMPQYRLETVSIL